MLLGLLVLNRGLSLAGLFQRRFLLLLLLLIPLPVLPICQAREQQVSTAEHPKYTENLPDRHHRLHQMLRAEEQELLELRVEDIPREDCNAEAVGDERTHQGHEDEKYHLVFELIVREWLHVQHRVELRIHCKRKQRDANNQTTQRQAERVILGCSFHPRLAFVVHKQDGDLLRRPDEKGHSVEQIGFVWCSLDPFENGPRIL